MSYQIFSLSKEEHPLSLANKYQMDLVVGPLVNLPAFGHFVWDGEKLYYQGKVGKLSFNFEELWAYHQRKNYSLRSEPFYRSLALKGKEKVIWDATGGTGKDAILLLAFGARLVVFERNLAIFILLEDALRRANNNAGFPASRISIGYGDPRDSASSGPPDIIYYDPMYPEKKKKSALPRIEMQIFSELVGGDNIADEIDFLNWSLLNAKERVIVKRPLQGNIIGEVRLSATYKGKTTRYDMYRCGL